MNYTLANLSFGIPRGGVKGSSDFNSAAAAAVVVAGASRRAAIPRGSFDSPSDG